MPAWSWASPRTAAQRKVIGIDASAHAGADQGAGARHRPEHRELVERQDIAEDDIVLVEDYAYPCYGVPSQETLEAIRLAAASKA